MTRGATASASRATNEELDRIECRDAIARCLRGLPPTQREIVFLRYGEDLTQSEIGTRCRPAQMQVSRVLRRALQLVQMWAACHRAS